MTEPRTSAETRSMVVIQGLDRLDPSLGRLFVVVGVFDGLHLGHRYLLDHLRREAGARGARPAVVTFDHHPDEVLSGAAPSLLMDPAERVERLDAAGVEVAVVETFDAELRDTPFDVFVRRIGDRVDLAGFLMTPDSAFGHRRAGTPETVADLGRSMGFDVAVVQPFSLDGQPVSSSTIRKAIEAGDLAAAERLLGRPYAVVGTAGASAEDAATRVTFEMPVALPPAGEHRAQVDQGDEHVELRARVADGSIELPGWTGRAGSRARIIFRSR